MSRLIWDRDQKIETSALMNILDQFAGEVLRVGDDERLTRLGPEDTLDHVDQFRRCVDDTACGGSCGKTQRLVRIGVEDPECLGHLGWFFSAFLDALSHPAFTVAADTMWIDGKEFPSKIPARKTNLSQRHLQPYTFCHRSVCEQEMNGLIGGHEGQSVGQFKSTASMKRPIGPDAGRADGRFVDHLQGHSRLDSFGRLARPATQQVPGSQAQMFGQQQPDASQVSADLVRHELPYPALDAEGITRLGFGTLAAGVGFDGRKRLMARTTPIEFFFEGRNRRSRGRRYVC